MKHIIYSDIDGTFYTHKQEIHQNTIQDIQKAKDLGIPFVLATGNPFFAQAEYVSKISGADYFVGSNGSFIKDLKSNEIIYENRIPNDKAQKIVDIANKYNLGLDCWDENNVYVLDNGHYPEKTISVLVNVILRGGQPVFSNNLQIRPYKMEFVCHSKENLDKGFEELQDIGLYVSRITDKHCEITNNNVSKGDAVKVLNEKLGFDLSNTMAIGDSANDESMLSIVGYSYLMANAHPNMHGKAKYHTSSAAQNGLGEAIQDFIFRNKLDKK